MKFMSWDTSEKWPNGPGELAPEGFRQQYLVGKYIREKYIINETLLEPNYNDEQLIISSTNFNRTIQSAIAQAYGMYSDMDYAKESTKINIPVGSQDVDLNNINHITLNDVIPIQINQTAVDAMLLPGGYCSEYISYINRRKNTKVLSRVYDNYRDVIAIVANSFKELTPVEVEIKTLDIIDSINSNKIFNYQLPLEFDDVWIARAKKLYIEVKNYKEYQPDYLSRYSGTELLNFIISKFEERLSGKNKLRGMIFLAHDTTIMNFFASLNAHLPELPKFASVLLIELHDVNSMPYVRVLYNDEPVNFQGISSDFWTFTEFKDFVSARAFKNLEKSCSEIDLIVENKIIHNESDNLFSLLILDVLFMIASVSGIYFLIKKIHK